MTSEELPPEELRRRAALYAEPWKSTLLNAVQSIERLQQGNAELRGAMAAQDEREKSAGETCGVPYELHGCDWPDGVATEVLTLRRQVAALREDAERYAYLKRDKQYCVMEQDRDCLITHVSGDKMDAAIDSARSANAARE